MTQFFLSVHREKKLSNFDLKKWVELEWSESGARGLSSVVRVVQGSELTCNQFCDALKLLSTFQS